MANEKLGAGDPFPIMTLEKLGGGTRTLGKPEGGYDWQMVVVYRGKHCPMCTSYLKELNALLPEFNALGVDVVAVSGDPQEKAAEQIALVGPDFDVAYGMSVEQMREIGLYVSNPRSPQETDRQFSEPGLFVINAEGAAQLIDISNAPFVRPQLKTIVGGIRFIRDPENNYPVRGTA